jgi:TPR repeat protein
VLISSSARSFEQYWPFPVQSSAAIPVAEFKEGTSPADGPLILALRTYREGKYDAASKFSVASALKNDSRGQFGLGFLYLTGKGVARDSAKAAGYLQLAAKQNSALAITFLSIMYDGGYGLERDRPAAARLYEKAAQAGSTNAMGRLANMNFHGMGIPRDVEGAVALATKAAAPSDLIGQYVLGLAYFGGTVVGEDHAQGMQYFKISADSGLIRANANLALLYVRGKVSHITMNLPQFTMRRELKAMTQYSKAGLAFFICRAAA